MSKPLKVISIGHLCVDRICFCEEYPPENASRHILRFSCHAGGTAAQAAVVLARLGVSVGYMGPFGDDEVGDFLYQDCLNEGLDLSRCGRFPDILHSFTNVMVSQKLNTRTFFSYHGNFPPMEFTPADVAYLSQAKILHLDNTRNDNALAAASIARQCGVLISLDGSSMDPDNRKNWELVRMADILITSETFPGRLTGNPNRRAALLEIENAVHPKVLISTGGETGCLAVVNGNIEEFPAYFIHPVDTTGAGDVFHGAFLYGLLNGYGLAENICFSSAAAAISCGAAGGRDGIPCLKDISRFIAEYPYQ